MLITVTDNENGCVLYSGSDPAVAQAVLDANAETFPYLGIHAGPDAKRLIGSESAIDDEIYAQDCDVVELVEIAERRNATVMEIYMNFDPAKRKAS